MSGKDGIFIKGFKKKVTNTVMPENFVLTSLYAWHVGNNGTHQNST
jgi:hypothetical protein